MKAQTCCCHVCKTSLNQYKREYMPCTVCNKIVCKNCFGTKFKESTWEQAASERSTWLCPSCSGNCPCNRCRKKPTTKLGLQLSLGLSGEDFKHSNGHHVFSFHHNLSSPPSPTSSSSSKDNCSLYSASSSQYNGIALGNGNGTGSSLNGIPASMERDRYAVFVEKEKYSFNLGSPSNHHSERSSRSPKVDKLHLSQLQDYLEREKRCEANVKEMERLLNIMKKEREEVIEERIKLEELIQSAITSTQNESCESVIEEEVGTPENSKSPDGDSTEFEVSSSVSTPSVSASPSPFNSSMLIHPPSEVLQPAGMATMVN